MSWQRRNKPPGERPHQAGRTSSERLSSEDTQPGPTPSEAFRRFSPELGKTVPPDERAIEAAAGVPLGLASEFSKLNYEIIRFVGRGGMGEVYEARYRGKSTALGLDDGQTVAIKLLSEQLVNTPESRTRFFREAEIVRGIRHQNVVRMYESGEVSSRPFFVMEFLRGTDLADEIAKSSLAKKTIGAARSLRIARQVCLALAEAHSKGVIHRDIKPENIFLCREGTMDDVKLIDLGLARLSGIEGQPQITKAGNFVGTPFYLAPETVPDSSEAPSFDHRIDIYSLGATLYEMLCGRPPFVSQTPMAVLYQLKTQAPQPLREKRPDLGIPLALESLVLKCLEKNPDKRYPSAQELVGAIDGLGILKTQEDAPASAPPPLPKKKRPKVFWAIPPLAAVAAALGIFGAMKLRDKALETSPIYRADIHSEPAGASVFIEERLDGGTMVTRKLGQTPLEVQLKGRQRIYLELAGHKRSYHLLEPSRPSLRHRIQGR